MPIARRELILGALATSGLLATGCSFDRGDSGAQGAGQLRMAGWSGTTWSRNFNIFSPISSSVTPGTSLCYEPLVRLDRTRAGRVLPHLSESWSFDDEGRQLDFTLRTGVRWSDGKPFTAEDVAFTWQLVLDKKTNLSYPFRSVEALDETRVRVRYANPAYADLVAFAIRRIMPKHVWATENPTSFTNPDPIGTGPFIVQSFSPQQVLFRARSDYWGGPTRGIETVKISAMSSDAAKDGLLKGTVDFSAAGWINADQDFVAVSPAKHHYTFYPVGTCDGIVFNTRRAPYDDPAVRRALRAAADLQAAAEAVKIGYGVPTAAGLDPSVYAELLPPGQAQQRQDLDLARRELREAGWTISQGKLVKDGQSYTLRYDVMQAYVEWLLTGQILADQWKQGLGLVVEINQLAEQPYSQLVASGDYGMLSSTPTEGSQISDVITAFDSSLVAAPGQQNKGNEMFFQNAELDRLGRALRAIPPGERLEEVRELAIAAQQILIRECPFIATSTAGWKAGLNTGRWTGWPVKGETTYAPNGTLPADFVLTVMNLTRAR